MKKVKFFGKFILFAAIFAVLFICAQEVLRDKWLEGEYNTTSKVKGFYAEEENTLDVIFVGSSQMYADMAPAVLFEEYGIASYDFCANEQPLWVSYYYIKEALAHQNPQAIVLDVFTVYGDDYEDEGVMHINLDDLPMGKNKVDAIRDGVPADLRYSYYLPMAKYHNTWTGLYEGKATAAFYDKKDPYKGYSPFVFAGDYEQTAKAEVVNQTEIQPIPDRAREWLYRIIDLCDEEGVQLVLIKTPNGNAERQKLYNDVAQIANERGVPFFNMNTILDGQAHIDVLQAEKVSSLMGAYLTGSIAPEGTMVVADKLTFVDHRKDPAYASWHEDAQLFYRDKIKCEIARAQDMASYLPVLLDENLIVLIAGKNTNGNTFANDDIVCFNNGLNAHCTLNVDGAAPYLLAIEGGQIVYETPIADGEAKPQVDLQLAGLDVSMHSDGGMMDGTCNLFINGTDFSMDMDGFNIVIYDKVLGETFEMAAFDVADEMRLVRK